MGLPWRSSEPLHLPRQEVQAQSLVRELRSHMSHGQKNQNINNRSNTVTNSIETPPPKKKNKKNDPHIKKKTLKRVNLMKNAQKSQVFRRQEKYVGQEKKS